MDQKRHVAGSVAKNIANDFAGVAITPAFPLRCRWFVTTKGSAFDGVIDDAGAADELASSRTKRFGCEDCVGEVALAIVNCCDVDGFSMALQVGAEDCLSRAKNFPLTGNAIVLTETRAKIFLALLGLSQQVHCTYSHLIAPNLGVRRRILPAPFYPSPMALFQRSAARVKRNIDADEAPRPDRPSPAGNPEFFQAVAERGFWIQVSLAGNDRSGFWSAAKQRTP
jgi:hypothetical protein